MCLHKKESHVLTIREVAQPNVTQSAGRYLTTEQAMRYLSVGRTTLYRLRREGLDYIKIGKATRWKVDELDAPRGADVDHFAVDVRGLA